MSSYGILKFQKWALGDVLRNSWPLSYKDSWKIVVFIFQQELLNGGGE